MDPATPPPVDTGFLPPPGSVPVSGEITPGTSGTTAPAGPAPAPVTSAPITPKTSRPKSLGWMAVIFYGLTITVLGFFVPAWLNALSFKGMDGNLRILFGPDTQEQGLTKIVELIAGAKQEVMIGARYANNKEVLQALLNCQQRGLQVLILLTPEEKSSVTTADFLINNGFSRKHIFFDKLALTSQLLLIDQATVLTGNLPFNTGLTTSAGDMLLIHNPKIAAQYRLFLEKRVRASLAQ